MSLTSCALADRFFTTSTTCEAHKVMEAEKCTEPGAPRAEKIDAPTQRLPGRERIHPSSAFCCIWALSGVFGGYPLWGGPFASQSIHSNAGSFKRCPHRHVIRCLELTNKVNRHSGRNWDPRRLSGCSGQRLTL